LIEIFLEGLFKERTYSSLFPLPIGNDFNWIRLITPLPMRTFVTSDIHGNNEAFNKALKHIQLQKDDKLILLGDYIDRGVDSKGVLDTILYLKEQDFNLVCLIGNHEQMFLDAINDHRNLSQWIMNGGDTTLSSFLTRSIHKIPIQYIDLIKSFNYYYEDGKYIFVHAALNMFNENPFDDLETILWSREPDWLLNEAWLKDRTLIHGHSPTEAKLIIESVQNRRNIICIDNGSFVKREGFGNICVLQLENFSIEFIQ